MLMLFSKFVLEVLPYVLTALIAAIVVPGFVMAQLHGTPPSAALNGAERPVSAFELVGENHTGYAQQRGLAAAPLHDQVIAK